MSQEAALISTGFALVVILIILVIYGCSNVSIAPNGVKTVAAFSCGGDAAITLQTSLYKHPYNFETGDNAGETLFYTAGTQPPIILYDNNFQPTENNPLPGPKPDFAPLPAAQNTASVTVFALSPPIKHRAAGEFPPPPYLNIFLDPATTSPSQYRAIATCLTANAAGINISLANLTNGFPSRDRRGTALQLGGIVLGKPDYQDQTYLLSVKKLWNATDQHPVLPDYGDFLLFPGQTARGIIAGQHISISLDAAGKQTLLANGKPVGEQNGWTLGDAICTSQNLSLCGKHITYVTQNDDGSGTFAITIKTAPNSYAQHP